MVPHYPRITRRAMLHEHPLISTYRIYTPYASRTLSSIYVMHVSRTIYFVQYRVCTVVRTHAAHKKRMSQVDNLHYHNLLWAWVYECTANLSTSRQTEVHTNQRGYQESGVPFTAQCHISKIAKVSIKRAITIAAAFTKSPAAPPARCTRRSVDIAWQMRPT